MMIYDDDDDDDDDDEWSKKLLLAPLDANVVLLHLTCYGAPI